MSSFLHSVCGFAHNVTVNNCNCEQWALDGTSTGSEETIIQTSNESVENYEQSCSLSITTVTE